MDKISVIARNKRASHDYFLSDMMECGICLTGTEIKSIRLGKCSINEAYCHINKNELYISNMHISKYEQGNIFNHQEIRERKLLAHKREIRKLIGKITIEGYTLIPVEVYLSNGLCKIKVALAKGKKNYDKRNDLKEKAMNDEIRKAEKNRY